MVLNAPGSSVRGGQDKGHGFDLRARRDGGEEVPPVVPPSPAECGDRPFVRPPAPLRVARCWTGKWKLAEVVQLPWRRLPRRLPMFEWSAREQICSC